MEDIHARMYSLLLNAIIVDSSERKRLENAIKDLPSIAAICKYMSDTSTSTAPLSTRLLRSAAAEGLFFQGCFYIIFWYKERGLMNGLTDSNDRISKDENIHSTFSLYLYRLLEAQLPRNEVYSIYRDAMKVVSVFINDMLPEPLAEMNATLMTEFVQSQVDVQLHMLGHPPLYGVKCKSSFMDQINMDTRTNFFERLATDYTKRMQTCDDTADPYAIADDF
jgi:ribonucleoside-diphosphate reductase beta chain